MQQILAVESFALWEEDTIKEPQQYIKYTKNPLPVK